MLSIFPTVGTSVYNSMVSFNMGEVILTNRYADKRSVLTSSPIARGMASLALDCTRSIHRRMFSTEIKLEKRSAIY